jgi:hypothetical protein
MNGLTANGFGTGAGFGWPVIGVIRRIPTKSGFAAAGKEDLVAGIGRRDTGADFSAQKPMQFWRGKFLRDHLWSLLSPLDRTVNFNG